MNWQKTDRGRRPPLLSSPWKFMATVFFRRSQGIYFLAGVLWLSSVGSSTCRADRLPVLFSQPNPASSNGIGGVSTGNKEQNGHAQPPSRPHLAQWLRQHQNMTLQQQERALRNEPGFDRLPQRHQQRLLNRLQQLNAMPPRQRERTLQRMEALEKLTPQQRRQVHSVMQEVGGLPPQRQRMMRKAFHDLSQLPQEQREAILGSPQFKDQFSDRERQILGTLMSVQPYLPVQGPGVEYGGK